MLPFSTLILRSYYQAIGWNEDNSYSQLTRSSSGNDFQLPQSLILQLANSPTPIFFTSYALDALPQLNGSLSYITTSEALRDIGPSRNLPFKHVVDRFRIYPLPHRPPPKDELWLGGRRVEGRDYLLYSRLHFPSLHLSGLATSRLTPTLQLHLAFLSHPQPPSARPSSPSGPSHSRQPSETSTATTASRPPPPGNIILSLQHDTGRHASEYTYSVQDGMFGWRGLWNFGWKGMSEGVSGPGAVGKPSLAEVAVQGAGREDGETMDGGLKGRFSAGAEVYFSAMQRSFGISTGLRFSTLPTPSSGSHHPLSPPTTLTLLYNPLMGFVSTAYSAQISPTIALSSRYGVNVYSYESDLSIGGEWWIGRRRGKRVESGTTPGLSAAVDPQPMESTRDTAEDRDGILKAKISGNWSISLLYEARIRNCLVSIGVISDLVSRQKPIRSVGVEVQYFS
ncbi:uncharacterized protein MKK02DRAFT_16182 [Dioszegia hungarica]|uniref:Mitochondrial distribution and morphology protein 10 n=1 Tax=Dioszegia hungarica TaxID=4972 RepID=A0AA38LRP6_9TREE|nr:uncharacterized protein MKK02DRAFT_16182 [Dioszegia hungarica]KAI9634632.1 hypothetical protein MKK02DRAFT_16182 [Dioszegia hungarica]